jgi:hypothetical protein
VSPYRSQSVDTPEEIDRMLFQRYRQMTPGESIERVWELNEWAWERARSGFRRQFPSASERDIELRLAALKHGPQLVARALGRDPESLFGE